MDKRVFISYRRDDTAPVARLVYDRLRPVLSKERVFFDVSTIQGGEDFKKKITTEIAKCDTALILIGDQWLGGQTAPRRIDAPDDYVRLEIREASAAAKTMIPVLVSGATMPKASELPDDIGFLTSLNALRLRHESFDDDMEAIIATILGESDRRHVWEARTPLWLTLAYLAGGIVLSVIALIALALAHFAIFQQPLAETIGTPMTILLGCCAIGGGGWLGLRSSRRRALRVRPPRSFG